MHEPPPVRLRMGNYAPTRMWESQLRAIYDWARDMVSGRASWTVGKGEAAPTASLTPQCHKQRLAGQRPGGRGRDDCAAVPEGTNVVAATGDGYQGLRMDEKAKRNTAVWTVPRMAPKDKQSFTITLSRAGTAADNLRGSVRWSKPTVKTGPFDEANINPAPL